MQKTTPHKTLDIMKYHKGIKEVELQMTLPLSFCYPINLIASLTL
jgi:hypothetical protein